MAASLHGESAAGPEMGLGGPAQGRQDLGVPRPVGQLDPAKPHGLGQGRGAGADHHQGGGDQLRLPPWAQDLHQVAQDLVAGGGGELDLCRPLRQQRPGIDLRRGTPVDLRIGDPGTALGQGVPQGGPTALAAHDQDPLPEDGGQGVEGEQAPRCRSALSAPDPAGSRRRPGRGRWPRPRRPARPPWGGPPGTGAVHAPRRCGW